MSSSTQTKQVVFVDSQITAYQSLLDGLPSGSEVVLLHAGQDGLAQMAAWAATHSGYDAIHVLGHGAPGALQLGALTLDASSLSTRAADLATLGAALTATGDLLLYGCNVAAGLAGVDFVQRLALASAADVAASSDATGASAQGGNWVLEALSGPVEASSLALPAFASTLATTSMVTDINAGNAASNPGNLTNVNGTLYFGANDGIKGNELWKSDGTAAGTVLVKDIRTGTDSSYPANLANINGTLYFMANDGINGNELWKSDGTAAGTVMVKDIQTTGTGSSNPSNLTNVNGTLYFQATSASGTELWKSNGTGAGTVLVKDIKTGPGSSSFPNNLTNVNGTLYFAAANDKGTELWKSDGTANSTVQVKDIYAGNSSSTPLNLTNVNGTLYFQATNANGTELWKSDGTGAGTVMVKDIQANAGSSDPSNLTNVNGTLYFSAYDDTNGAELWKSDGTALGTVMVKDIQTGAASSRPSYLTNVNGTLYFLANDGIKGNELWKSDGTAAGTVLVKDILAGSSSSAPQNLTNVNGTLYFKADDGINGTELWKSDGTDAGTVLVNDINAGSGSSSPSELINVNGSLLFRANDGTNGTELWAVANATPTLDATKSPTLGNLNSYAKFTPPTNGSTTGAVRVSSLIDSGGTLANFTDADSTDLPGIAITGFNTGASGSAKLYYSLDAGAHWNDVGAVSAVSARVLYADANTWVYYAPAAYASGSVSDAITFKAWDQSGGYSNGQAAVNTVGGLATTLASNSANAANVYDVAVSGKYAYVANTNSGLQVLDISSSTPTLVATVATGNLTSGAGQALGVVLSGNFAYVADNAYGLRVINISNPLKPSLVGTYETPGFARNVAVTGKYAYVAATNSGLQIIDISTPSTPKLVASYSAGSQSLLFGVALSADGNTAYAAFNDKLQVLNVTNKASVPTPTLTVWNSDFNFGTLTNVAVKGGYAYVTAGSEGLFIVDLVGHTGTTAGQRVGWYNTTGTAQSVVLSADGKTAFVGDGASGLQAIDVSNPTNPKLAGTYDTPGDARGLALSADGTTVYQADTSKGLQVISLTPVPTPNAFSTTTDTASANLTVKVPPSIKSATYDASTGVLTVTGTGMAAGDTIDVGKLTVNQIPSQTSPFDTFPGYTLTSANVNASSATSFSVKLNAADQAALNASMPSNGNFRRLYIDGSYYIDSYYNLSAATNWDSSAASSADPGIGGNANANGNLILVSNVGMAPATATKLLFTIVPNYVTSGMSGLSASVRAVDASGKVVSTFSGNITLALASGAGQFTGKALTVTAVDGVVSFTGLSYTPTADQETFTLRASATGLTSATTGNVISNVRASKLEFSVQPAATLASGTDSSFSTVPVVRAVDANGTLDTGFNGAVTLKLNGQGNVTTLSANGDTDTGTDSVTVNAVNGVATFTGLRLNYTNSASSDSVTLLASASLTSGTTSEPLQSATSNALTSIAANTNTPATLSDIYADASAALAVKTGVGTSLDFIKVSDPDSANTISVTVSATGGSISGLVDASSGTAGIQISGSVSDVNTALAKAQLVASSAGATTITVTASDGVQGTDVANATYYLSASNAAPAFSSVSTLSGGKEDGAYSLGFADLLKASNAVDPGGSVEAFVVKSLASGTLFINGSAWAATTNDVIKTGDTVLWTPASNANGSALEAFSVVARDNLLALSETQVPVNVAVAAVNDAPTLSGSYTFAGLQASAIAPTGVTVASLLNTSSATTSSDVDTGAAPVGIAITGSVGKGTWQISADSTNGTNGTWSALGAVSDAGAKLLAASNYVRYLPDGESGESGSSAASLTYRASDGTSGASGTADTTLNGGSSAFSSTAVTATLAVTAVTKPLDLTLTSGAATQTYAQTTPVALDPSLVLSGNTAPLAGAKVMINGGLVTAEDRLTIKGITGSTSGTVTTYQNIVGDIDASYDSATGVMSLSSTAPVADYQDALRLVSYQNIGNNAHTAPRTIDISAGTMLQFTISGAPHFYEYVSGDVTWTDARDGAAARVYAGMTGYLATITSAAENSYIASRLSSNGWIGASDATTEGGWKWVTGPVAEQVQFSTGATVVSGQFANWDTNEPNDYGSGEDYAQMRADTGKWNDIALSPSNSDTNRPRGYLVEYSDPSVTSVSFAKTITLTPQVLNQAPVLASGTPTLTSIDENAIDNTGQLVSAVTATGGTITDGNSSPIIGGIAITALEVGNGTWQYRLANQGVWHDVGKVSDAQALLLRPTDALRFVPDAKNATTASFTYHAWDQTSGTAGATVDASATGNASAFSTASNTATISVTAVNDAPTLTSATLDFAGITEDDTGNIGQSVAKLLGGSFRDADLGTSAGAAITGKTVVGSGTWEYSTDSGSHWTALGTLSESSALLLAGSDLVRFKPDALLGGTPTLTLRGWDGSNETTPASLVHTSFNIATTGSTTAFSATSATASISVKSINDAPAAAASSGSAAYTEHGTATALDAALTLTDDGTIAAASVRISSGFSAGDALNFSTQSGITGSYDAATGVLKLSGSATPAQYQTALQSVTFSSSSDDPTQLSASRTLKFTTTDSDGLGSAAVTRGLAITPVANAPTLANAPGSGWVYTQYDGARVLAPELALADLDDTQMSSATVTLWPLSTGFSSSAEQLGLVKTSAMSAQSGDWTASISGVSLTYTATTGVLALSGTADKAVYQDILRSVTYSNGSTSAIASGAESRSITWTVRDAYSDGLGITASTLATTGITLKYAALPPLVTHANDASASYTEVASGVVLASNVVPAAYTGGIISKATVKVGQGFTTGDQLAVGTSVTGIDVSFDASIGMLTLSTHAGATVTASDYQTALQSVKFSSTSLDPTASATTRSILWQVYDANGDVSKIDAGATTTLNITAVNNAPTLTNLPASGDVKYTEGSGAVRVASSVTLSDADDHLFSQVQVTLGGTGLVAAKEFLGIEGQTPDTGSMAANSNWSIADINSSGVAASYVASTGVLTLSSTNPVEGKVYQSILNLLTYNSTDTDPTITASTRSLTWQVTDGNSDGVGAQTSTAQTSAITLVPVNNAPTLGGLTATVSHTEATSSNVGSGLTLSDADDASIAGAMVQIAKGRSAGDVLAFTAGSTGITGSYSSETGVLSLTGTASVANYVTALQSVTFNTGTDPTATNASRTLVWSVTDANSDGAGAASSVQARQTVNVTATANAPVVTPGTTGKFTKGDAPVAINAALTLSDADDGYIHHATVTISSGLTTGDVLSLPASFASSADISGSYSNGVLTLSGTATLAQYQDALRAVTFENTSNNPVSLAASRTITWAVTDANSDGFGSAAAGNNTSTISVGTVNSAPVVRSGGELSYTEGGSAAVIDSTLTLKDDDANMSGAAVTITSGLTSGDVLGFSTQNGISGSYSTGVLTLSGSATVANYVTALRSVTFANSGDDPTASGTAGSRTITWNVTDGNSVAKTSSDVTSSVTVKAVNDAPAITGSLPTPTFTQGGSSVSVGTNLTISDADDTQLSGATVRISNYITPGDALSFTAANGITGEYDGYSGVLKLSGTATLAQYETALQSVKFSNDSTSPTYGSATSRTFSWSVIDANSDGVGAKASSAVNSSTAVAAVNRAPFISLRDSISNENFTSGPTGTNPYGSDKVGAYRLGDQGANLVRDIMVEDRDSTALSGATVSISSGTLKTDDTLSLNFTGYTPGTISGVFSGGVLTLTGAASLYEYQQALRSVTFSNVNNDAAHAGDRSISWTVSDNASTPAISDAATTTLKVSVATPPPSVAFNAISVDNRLNASDVGSDLTITGTSAFAEDGQAVTVYLNGQSYYGAISNNAWSVSVPHAALQALPNGGVLLSANVMNAGGYIAPTASAELQIDTTAPIIKLDAVMVDNRINLSESNAGITVSGTTDAEPGQWLTVSLGDSSQTVQVQELSTVSELPTWSASFSGTSVSSDGTLRLVALVKDQAGNAGELNTLVEVDRVVPTLTVDSLVMDYGATNAASDDTAVISGTTDAELGQELSLTLGGANRTVVIENSTSTVSSQATAWSIQVGATVLSGRANGSLPISAQIRDNAGNSTQLHTSYAAMPYTPPPVVTVTTAAGSSTVVSTDPSGSTTIADPANGGTIATTGSGDTKITHPIGTVTLNNTGTGTVSTSGITGSTTLAVTGTGPQTVDITGMKPGDTLTINNTGTGTVDLSNLPDGVKVVLLGTGPVTLNDNDGATASQESKAPALTGGTVGDGNGDGTADALQSNVASIPFLKTTTAVSNPASAAPVYVSLVADSLNGKIDTTDQSSAVTLNNVKQLDAPAYLPSAVKMPLGQISFDAKVSTAGTTETFSLYVDSSLGLNAYWKQNAAGKWINLASSEYGGQVVTEGGKTRLDFQITDGGQFDSDGKADGVITDPGAPGIEKDSDHDQFPDALEAANGLVVGVKDNDVFTSSKFFVMQLYRDILYREAEPGGLAFWQNQMDTGALTRPQVASAFLASAEFVAGTGGVARLYFGALQRLPDAAGMDFWMQQEQSGTTLNQIASAFTASKEFTDIYGSLSNTAFVDKLYLNVQGQAPTLAQESFWVDQLTGGASRAEVLLGFTDSADYKTASKTKLSVALDYIGLLGRPAEQAGFDWWVEQQDTNIPEVEVIGGFIVSTEYHGRFLP